MIAPVPAVLVVLLAALFVLPLAPAPPLDWVLPPTLVVAACPVVWPPAFVDVLPPALVDLPVLELVVPPFALVAPPDALVVPPLEDVPLPPVPLGAVDGAHPTKMTAKRIFVLK